jgi:protocatechuate 3,4-dioxygenase beta subunit
MEIDDFRTQPILRFIMYLVLTARIFFIVLALFFNLAAIAFSQIPPIDLKTGTSSIGGRVTIGGDPAVNKRVVVKEIKMRYPNSGIDLQGDVFIGVTDADGMYRVTGLHTGDYQVSVKLLGAYVPSVQSGQQSKQIHLDDDEDRANLDFSLVRGGVITGRVIDPDGKPIIAGFVSVNHDEGQNQAGRCETDDRGVYRIYGLPAGRYRVSAKALGKSEQKYATTYHPDVTDEKQSTVIEVKEGSEVEAIDIRLNNLKNEGYVVTGRVIDSESGEPVSDAIIYCTGIGQTRIRSQAASADPEGKFRLTGLTAGRYALIASPSYSSPNQKKFYSNQTMIDVTGADLGEVEVKASLGGAISGVMVFDDDRSPALRARLSQTIITGDYSIKYGNGSLGGDQSVKVKSDGSFLIEGLPHGIVNLKTGSSTGARPPLILRVERNGVVIPNSIDVKSGETITGIRLVVTDKTGTIRGQIIFTAGDGLPDGIRVTAFVHSNIDDISHLNSVIVDKKGRFVIEGLMDGEYSVILNKGPEDGSSASFAGSQRVQVVRGAEAQVTFTLDSNELRRKNER